MNRQALMKCLKLVSPALSKNPVPEIFRHFCFNGDSVMAFNDQIAISTELPGNTFHGALPKILLKLLNTIDSDEITLEPDGVDRCTVNWNSSDLKLITLPPSEFSFFSMPDFYANIFTKEQLAAFIEGIECCLCSVATDTNVPDRAGITAIFEDGKLILYSTNDQTMARAKLTVEDETLSGRIILNAAFCKRLVASKKKMKAIDVSFDGSFILADLTDATLFGRLLHSDNPPDFRKMILKHLSPVRTYIEIDKDVTEIIERACVIVNKRDDKRVRLNVDNSRLYVLASSWDETAKIDHPDVSVLCNPELIKRGLPRFQRWRITPDCIIMATRLEQTNLRYLISTGK